MPNNKSFIVKFLEGISINQIKNFLGAPFQKNLCDIMTIYECFFQIYVFPALAAFQLNQL